MGGLNERMILVVDGCGLRTLRSTTGIHVQQEGRQGEFEAEVTTR
jgi:hypothetical protein